MVTRISLGRISQGLSFKTDRISAIRLIRMRLCASEAPVIVMVLPSKYSFFSFDTLSFARYSSGERSLFKVIGITIIYAQNYYLSSKKNSKLIPSPSLYWDERYRQDNTTWDMGRLSPPLQGYFDQLTDKSLSILIPGCGNSYEAAYLLEKGWGPITLIDISEILITRLKEKFFSYPDPPLQMIAGDFFDLPAT